MEPDDRTATKEDIANLQRQVTRLSEAWTKLRRYMPPVAARRERRIRLTYEVTGVAIAAAGAWWVYPPASLLLIGGWVLADVVASRRRKKG